MQPIIGFIFSNKGLMHNLTFEGSKITRIGKQGQGGTPSASPACEHGQSASFYVQ